ncbi:MAG TPA: ABC transporter permease [Candidatus Angelobacter sp.]|jgi:predicted permease|nr:ABC transporter permease [Candidatus Angelobacter sp.]
MKWIKQLFSRRLDDLSEKIQEHLEEKIAELIASGMSREEASIAARREFGNVLLLEERGRQVWRWPAIDILFADFKYTLRQLRRNPGFTVTVILTLMLAIGVNIAVFSVAEALLIRPLPYPEPERLAALVAHKSGSSNGQSFSEDDNSHDGETWELVRDNVPAVEAAVYNSATGVNLQAGATARYVHQQGISATYFHVLGIRPFLGRYFNADEDRPNGPKAVILSFDLWKSLFASDPQAVGKSILLKGEPHTVVGVLAEHTSTPTRVDVWTPLQPSRSGQGAGSNFGIILRLREGRTWQEVDAQLRQVHTTIVAEFLQFQKSGQAWLQALPLQKDIAKTERLPILALMAAVSFILLIACANLAGLMLVRVSRRRAELCTRLALGATRWAILRQIIMEPLLLICAGGAAGLGAAFATLGLLQRVLPADILPAGGLRIDGGVLVFAVAASVCTGLLIGVLPALEASRVQFQSTVGAGAGRSIASAGRRRTRQALIAVEVTLTVVLLAGAGLLIRTLVYLETLPPGFDPGNVMAAQLSLDDARYRDAAAFQNLLQQSVESMRRIPGVESAAVGLSLPYERGLNTGVTIADGAQTGQRHMTSSVYVTPEYFRVLRIPLLAGRTFGESDTAESQRVVIVNASFAIKYLGAIDAVGRQLQSGAEVVGVVADVTKRPGFTGPVPLASEATMYTPATQAKQEGVNLAHTWFQPSWIVRTNGPTQDLAPAMQQALASVDPNLPFAGFRTMYDLQSEVLIRQSMEVTLLVVLAGLALLLSVVGIYGLVSNLVVQRTREIGIRMALGSTLRQAMVELGKAGIMAVACGLAAGLVFALLALRIIKSEVYGVRTYDPLTLAVVCSILILAALAASFTPTLRIARINPASTLRAE